MSVSIVMAAYNAENTIAETLESLIAQTYPDKEIIVTDDGSQDSTGRILDEFASRYPDLIKVIHQANQGQSIARNAAIAEAKGDFIAFMDSDDLWAPNKIERQVEFLSRNPEFGMVYTEGMTIDAEGKKLESFDCSVEFTGNCFETLYTKNNIIGTSVMVRRPVLEDVGTFVPELRACENWELWTRISHKYAITFLDEELAYYRRHGSNMTSNTAWMRENRLKAIHHNHVLYRDTVPNEARMTRNAYYMAHRGFASEYLGALDLRSARAEILSAIRYNPLDPRMYFWLIQSLMGRKALVALRRLKSRLKP